MTKKETEAMFEKDFDIMKFGDNKIVKNNREAISMKLRNQKKNAYIYILIATFISKKMVRRICE